VVLSLKDIKQSHELNLTYLSACWIIQDGAPLAINNIEMLKVVRKAFYIMEVWNPGCCHGNKNFKLILQNTVPQVKPYFKKSNISDKH